jgi:hypothetical protein
MTQLQVCDIVEYGLDSFGEKPQTWRVEMHMKRCEDILDRWEPSDIAEQIVKSVCLKSREEDRKIQKDRGLPHNRRYKLVYCRPEEATHVSLVSICGAIAPISECKKIRTVDWPAERIEEYRKNAVSEFWLKNDFAPCWDWE